MFLSLFSAVALTDGHCHGNGIDIVMAIAMVKFTCHGHRHGHGDGHCHGNGIAIVMVIVMVMITSRSLSWPLSW